MVDRYLKRKHDAGHGSGAGEVDPRLSGVRDKIPRGPVEVEEAPALIRLVGGVIIRPEKIQSLLLVKLPEELFPMRAQFPVISAVLP